ncbi:MAG: hypothetical protein R3D85_04485 [Paracoccaceae bacterium]
MDDDLSTALPEGWYPLSPEQTETFQEQLAREIGRTHPIFAYAPRAVARFGGSDDVVYAAEGWQAPYFVCHLAWPNPDTRPRFIRWLRPLPNSNIIPALSPLSNLADLARYFD